MWRDWMKWEGHVERLDEVGGACGEVGGACEEIG